VHGKALPITRLYGLRCTAIIFINYMEHQTVVSHPVSVLNCRIIFRRCWHLRLCSCRHTSGSVHGEHYQGFRELFGTNILLKTEGKSHLFLILGQKFAFRFAIQLKLLFLKVIWCLEEWVVIENVLPFWHVPHVYTEKEPCDSSSD